MQPDLILQPSLGAAPPKLPSNGPFRLADEDLNREFSMVLGGQAGPATEQTSLESGKQLPASGNLLPETSVDTEPDPTIALAVAADLSPQAPPNTSSLQLEEPVTDPQADSQVAADTAHSVGQIDDKLLPPIISKPMVASDQASGPSPGPVATVVAAGTQGESVGANNGAEGIEVAVPVPVPLPATAPPATVAEAGIARSLPVKASRTTDVPATADRGRTEVAAPGLSRQSMDIGEPAEITGAAHADGPQRERSTAQLLTSTQLSAQFSSAAASGTPLAPTHPAQTGAAGTGTLQALLINVPVQEPGWDQAVSERVLMMANGKLQNAEIRLSPADLGPLRVSLNVDDGTANVSFHAHHTVTRDAIEQAMPRLREMLADNGLQLGRFDVSDSGTHDSTAEHQQPAFNTAGVPADADADADYELAPVARRAATVGLLDTFA